MIKVAIIFCSAILFQVLRVGEFPGATAADREADVLKDFILGSMATAVHIFMRKSAMIFLLGDMSHLSRAFRVGEFPGATAGAGDADAPVDFILGCIAASTCTNYLTHLAK